MTIDNTWIYTRMVTTADRSRVGIRLVQTQRTCSAATNFFNPPPSVGSCEKLLIVTYFDQMQNLVALSYYVGIYRGPKYWPLHLAPWVEERGWFTRNTRYTPLPTWVTMPNLVTVGQTNNHTLWAPPTMGLSESVKVIESDTIGLYL